MSNISCVNFRHKLSMRKKDLKSQLFYQFVRYLIFAYPLQDVVDVLSSATKIEASALCLLMLFHLWLTSSPVLRTCAYRLSEISCAKPIMPRLLRHEHVAFCFVESHLSPTITARQVLKRDIMIQHSQWQLGILTWSKISIKICTYKSTFEVKTNVCFLHLHVWVKKK